MSLNAAPEVQDPERIRLVEDIAMNLEGSEDQLTSETRAMFWLADISRLERLAERARTKGDIDIDLASQMPMVKQARVAKTWLAKTKEKKHKNDGTPSDLPSPSAKRRRRGQGSSVSSKSSKLRFSLDDESSDTSASCDQTPRNRDRDTSEQCRARDRQRCVLTHGGRPFDVAHVYPHALNTRAGSHSQEMFWKSLQLFWSQDRIKAWKGFVLGADGPESLQNCVCLSPDAHRYWSEALFALKPLAISEDQRTFELQFFWLPSDIKGSCVDLRTAPVVSAPRESTGDLIMLWDRVSREPIRTGNIVKIQTDDPKSKPLPSWHVMEMQWFLQRVAAMSAAADVDDEEFDYDSSGSSQAPDIALDDDDSDWDDDDFPVEKDVQSDSSNDIRHKQEPFQKHRPRLPVRRRTPVLIGPSF